MRRRASAMNEGTEHVEEVQEEEIPEFALTVDIPD